MAMIRFEDTASHGEKSVKIEFSNHQDEGGLEWEAQLIVAWFVGLFVRSNSTQTGQQWKPFI